MQRCGSFPNLQGFATAGSAGRLYRHSHAGTLARASVGPVVTGHGGGPAACARVGCSVGIADAIAQPNREPDANSLCDTLAKRHSGPDAQRDADPLIAHSWVPILNREVLLDDGVLTQTVDGALGGDLPVFEDVTAARYREGEIQVLLDQQEGQAELATHRSQDLLELLNNGRLKSFGGLIEEEQARLEHNAPRDRQHLLLATRQGSARLTASLS